MEESAREAREHEPRDLLELTDQERTARAQRRNGTQRLLRTLCRRSPESPNILVYWTQESSQSYTRLAYLGLVKPSYS